MLDIVVVGLKKTIQNLKNLQKQTSLANVVAINWTAKQAHDDVVKSMTSVFDRPTPWTMRGFYVWRADKAHPFAKLEARRFAGKGTPAYKYLEPEVFGGTRRAKGHERALRAAGVLPMSMYTVPGPGASLDQYGNMRGSEYVKILSQLKAFGEVGYTANITERSRKRGSNKTRSQYYVVRSRAYGQHPGIWKRNASGTKTVPVLFFVRQPTYTPRFPFHDIARSSVNANFDTNFSKALKQVAGSTITG